VLVGVNAGTLALGGASEFERFGGVMMLMGAQNSDRRIDVVADLRAVRVQKEARVYSLGR
jgi:hypothetical protein